MVKPADAAALRTLRTLVVTAQKSRVTVDHYPRCQNCGRPLAAYMARPWSIRCSHHGCKSENRADAD